MFKIELINGTFIHFVSEFTQTICSLKNSERNLPFYTSNTLSWVCLWKFVQFGHFYRRFHIRKRRNSARKNCIEIPLLMKDQIYTRDCTKQTSKLPRLQKIDLLKITFHLLTDHEQGYASFVNVRLKWVILSKGSLTVFVEKIVVTVIELKFVC